jgi:peptidoglycan/LPS O-acetylase OafA/YrhL
MRIKRLDILRAVAILLVVCAHAAISRFASRVGWAGVDLFFVLSGFLISGLLYTEYKSRGNIGLRTFFIRRGLKIYPAFYVMIAVTFAAQHLLWHGAPSPFPSFLNELLFIQNYRYGVWGHTWSLAVEEHFYIGLALLLLALTRISPHRADPFRSIPRIFAFVAVTCFALRVLTIWVFPPAENLTAHVTNPTHARIDALFFGVFLGYLYHFRPELIHKLFLTLRRRVAIAVSSILLLSVSYFVARESYFMLSFGLTFLYLGFGGILLLALAIRGLFSGKLAKLLEQCGTASAYLGRYSYSIYLWHTPLLQLEAVILRKVVHTQLPAFATALIGVLGSCAVGIFFAHLIEVPVLKLRERFFPALQPGLTPAGPKQQRVRERVYAELVR